MRLIHGAELADFADSAAVVAELDCVACVNMAVAQLNDAFGKSS
jgi:hypothetical protein